MSKYFSFQLHNECNKLVSRKSNKDLINEVMNKLNNNKENITNKDNNKDISREQYDSIKDSLSETIMIKIIKLIMCIK